MNTVEHGSKPLGSLQAILAAADLSAKANHLITVGSAGTGALTDNAWDTVQGLVVNGAASGVALDYRPTVPGGLYRAWVSATVVADARLQLDASNPGQLVTATTGPVVAIAREAVTGAGIITVQWVSNNNALVFQPAPVAVNLTATITTTDIVPEAIITSTTAAAVVATTPTGTQLTAQLPHVPVGGAINLYIINTGGTNAITLTAGTDVTVTGGAVTAAQYSGTFRLKRTAATTWVAYRIG